MGAYSGFSRLTLAICLLALCHVLLTWCGCPDLAEGQLVKFNGSEMVSVVSLQALVAESGTERSTCLQATRLHRTRAGEEVQKQV